MGHGYCNTENIGHDLSENLPRVISNYNYSNGYFGELGDKPRVRVIRCRDPIKDSNIFFKLISAGGKISEYDNGNRLQVDMADGSVITYRVITSTPNSPAVEISLRKCNKKDKLNGLKDQKIHFIHKR